MCKQENLRWRPKGSQIQLDMAHICLGQWFTNGMKCYKIEWLTCSMTTPLFTALIFTVRCCIISLSLVETVWTEIDGPKWFLVCYKDFTKNWKSLYENTFYKFVKT